MYRFKVTITDPAQRTKTYFVECKAGNPIAARQMVEDLTDGTLFTDEVTITLVEEKETT